MCAWHGCYEFDSMCDSSTCLLLSAAGQFMPVRWRTSTGTGTTASIQVCDLTSYDDDSLAALDKLSGEARAPVWSCCLLPAACCNATRLDLSPYDILQVDIRMGCHLTNAAVLTLAPAALGAVQWTSPQGSCMPCWALRGQASSTCCTCWPAPLPTSPAAPSTSTAHQQTRLSCAARLSA